MLQHVRKYLRENIDQSLTIDAWTDTQRLPFALKSKYQFYAMNLLDRSCILMEVIDEKASIDQLQKHTYQVFETTERQVVLLYKVLTRYRRRSLIEKKLAFIIEDGQMFIPFLGLDLMLTYDKINSTLNRFTTSAQVAYLHFLYHKNEVINTTQFAKKLGMKLMSASRALNELYRLNLIQYTLGGTTQRSKMYERIDDTDYFKRGAKYFSTPVKKTVYVLKKPKDALFAGLSALSKLSMLNAPDQTIMAMSKHTFEKRSFHVIEDVNKIIDLKPIELQLWDYDPHLFSKNLCVDVMSLYGSLKDEDDERVEQALEDVLRGETWYTD